MKKDADQKMKQSRVISFVRENEKMGKRRRGKRRLFLCSGVGSVPGAKKQRPPGGAAAGRVLRQPNIFIIAQMKDRGNGVRRISDRCNKAKMELW